MAEAVARIPDCLVLEGAFRSTAGFLSENQHRAAQRFGILCRLSEAPSVRKRRGGLEMLPISA